MRAKDEQRAKLLRTPREFKGRPQSVNLDDLYTPQELDLPDPTIGKKVSHQTVHKWLIIFDIKRNSAASFSWIDTRYTLKRNWIDAR